MNRYSSNARTVLMLGAALGAISNAAVTPGQATGCQVAIQTFVPRIL
jgi:hypothetical protein